MANPGNALGIFEDGDIYDQYDLNLFYKTLTYARFKPNTTHFPFADLFSGPRFLKAQSLLVSQLTALRLAPMWLVVAENLSSTCPCRFP